MTSEARVLSNDDESRAAEKSPSQTPGRPAAEPTSRAKKPRKKEEEGRPSGKRRALKRCTDVKDLPEELKRMVDRMLTEGSTFEDTVDAVNQLGGHKITLAAVESHFRSNLPLQQSRIKHLMQTSHNLKAAFANPESAQSDLAETVLLMGLLGLKRRNVTGDVQHAIRAKEQKENFQLKEDAFRLKLERSGLELEILKSRLKADKARLQLASRKLEQLKGTLERERSGTSLSPEMLRRIQEVYGIVSDDSRTGS